MAQQKQLQEDIAINKDFKLLTRSYQEHAIEQINFARYSVLGSREFSGDLSDIFANVKSSYKNLLQRRNIKSIVKKNGRDAWVLITANNKLYGDLILKICQLFAENVKKSNPNKVDLIIIGRQGRNFFEELKTQRPYTYFEVPDFNVSADYMKEICQNFILYENIIVYYGRFNNIVSQAPIIVSLSGEITEGKDQENANVSKIIPDAGQKKENFIFEPSLEEILIFFEKQVLSLLLNQAIQEAQLARYASRINAMEIAQTNIKKQLYRLKREEKMFKNMSMNKKQQELLAGRALWAKK